MPASSVVVTAIGMVTPLGLSAGENVRRCLDGETGIGRLRGLEPEINSCCSAAYVPEFELGDWLRFPKNAKFMNQSVRCAMQAGREAIDRSGIAWEKLDPLRIALYTGSGQTGLEYEEYFRALEAAWGENSEMDFQHLGGLPSRLIDRYIVLRYLANGGLGLLSTEFGIQGSSANLAQTDVASAQAISCAYYDLLEHRCDTALAGGYESLLGPSNYLAYQKEGLLSLSDPCKAYRPFDRTRDGLVLGEGAGFLVLERREDAEARGAQMLAELCGIENGINPEGVPSAESLNALGPAPFDFVIARGIGTPKGDSAEAARIHDVFGNSVPVSAFKSQLGYLGAAAAVVELALGILCARAGRIPPILRLCEADADCRLDLVQGSPRTLHRPDPLGLFLSGSWTGQSSAIAVRVLPNN